VRFLYGVPCLEVEQPDGEIADYLFRQVLPEGRECRAYVLTSPNGSESRCSVDGGGHWQCNCRAFFYRDRMSLEKRGRCKHLKSLIAELEPAREEQEVGVA